MRSPLLLSNLCSRMAPQKRSTAASVDKSTWGQQVHIPRPIASKNTPRRPQEAQLICSPKGNIRCWHIRLVGLHGVEDGPRGPQGRPRLPSGAASRGPRYDPRDRQGSPRGAQEGPKMARPRPVQDGPKCYAMLCNATRRNAMQSHTMLRNATQCDAMLCNITVCNATERTGGKHSPRGNNIRLTCGASAEHVIPTLFPLGLLVLWASLQDKSKQPKRGGTT